MKPYQLRSVGPDEPSPTRARPAGLSRARAGLPLLLLVFCLSTAFLSPAFAADGDPDPSFITGPGPYAGVQNIPEIKGQAIYNTGGDYNGYSLLFGSFGGLSVVGSPWQNNNCIARLTNLGALDTTFLNNQMLNGEIRGAFIYPHDYPVAALQDKILIWGRFNASANNVQYMNFARLNPHGDIDTSFTPVIRSWGGSINSVVVQGGGPSGAFAGTTDRILVGGYNLGIAEDSPAYQLVRLKYDGSLDTDFIHWGAPIGYINSIKILPSNDPSFPNQIRIFCSYPKNQDGKGGTYYVLVLDPTVTLPSTLNPPVASIGNETVDGPIHNWARQTDGKFLIGGDFQHVNNAGTWVPRNRVARLGSNLRTLDSYDVGIGPNGPVTQISPTSDDKMVLAGYFTTWNGAACGHLVRLTTTAAVDSFNSGTGADDRIVNLNWNYNGSGGAIYGYFHNYNGQPRGGIAGLNGDGSFNGNFANITAMAGWPGMVFSLATQSDGKILIGGDFNGVGGKFRGGFARINPNGSLDTAFKGGVDGMVRSVAVQADGKILLGGEFGQCQGYACTSLARLNPDGSLDTAFNPKLVGGDNSVNSVNQVVPLSNDVQIMIAGDIWNNNGGSPVARLNSDGSLDADFFANASKFSISGTNWSTGSRVAVVGSKYLVAGRYQTTEYGGGFLARFNGNGIPDTDFAPGTPEPHVQTMDGPVFDLLLQHDGKIVVSGFFSNIIEGSGNTARRAIARFSANGVLDTTFAPSLSPPSPADTLIINAMALQPNGKILIEENFLQYVSNMNWNYVGTKVARLNPNGSLDPNFTLGNPTQGWFYPDGGNSILRLPNGKALIGGVFSHYNGTDAWSLVRIFASPANFSPGAIYLLLGD